MKKAIFWDLLGTLGGDKTTLLNDFYFFPYAQEALKYSKENDYLNILITNQSAVGHGRMTLSQCLDEIDVLRHILAIEHCDFDDVLICPHRRVDQCECKKPKTTLLDNAVAKFNIDKKQSFVVGDSGMNDMLLAHHSSVRGVLVLTGEGYDSLLSKREKWQTYKPYLIAENAFDAIERIVELEKRKITN